MMDRGLEEVEVKTPATLEEELASFRQQWHEEIVHTNTENCDQKIIKKNKDHETSLEKKAADLFLQGIKYEKEGNFNVAVYFYRQAVRLVPDIESKISDFKTENNDDSDDAEDDDDDDDDDDDVNEENLLDESHDLENITREFSALHIVGLCQPKVHQQTTHVSALPTELLLLVVRWVISKDLDIKSLENMSLVCKWFYACARDAELWKGICLRIWGIKCDSIDYYENNWRRMYWQKPRVRYDGVYISTNSYVHIGEPSVGSYYKPCHLVEYYKFLRFFTDGSVLIYTTADDPHTVIHALNRPPYRDPSVYKGYYRLTGDNMANICFTHLTKSSHTDTRRRRGHREVSEIKEHHFFIQLILSNTKKKRNNLLTWHEYTLDIVNRKTGKSTGSSNIGVDAFRPYYFSPVKGYHSHTSSSL